MIDESQFQSKLNELVEKAAKQENRITQDEVISFFKGDGLTEDQMLMVFDYLLGQQISVIGYLQNEEEPKTQESETEEDTDNMRTEDDQAFVQSYREDLSGIPREKPGEKESLFASVQKDGKGKDRLIELYLPEVLAAALDIYYRDETIDVPFSDMVQEGSMGLILSIDSFPGVEQADSYLRMGIRQGIEEYLAEHAEEKHKDREMEKKVNWLNDSMHELAEELGRAVTMPELAEYMKISEDEILDIMKLAGEDLYDKYKNSGTEGNDF